MLGIPTVIATTAIIASVSFVTSTLPCHVSHSIAVITNHSTRREPIIVSPVIVGTFPVSATSTATAVTVVFLRRVNWSAAGRSDIKGLVFAVRFELNIEFDGLVVVESTVTVGFDGFVMDEEICTTVIRLDETIALDVIEPGDFAG